MPQRRQKQYTISSFFTCVKHGLIPKRTPEQWWQRRCCTISHLWIEMKSKKLYFPLKIHKLYPNSSARFEGQITKINVLHVAFLYGAILRSSRNQSWGLWQNWNNKYSIQNTKKCFKSPSLFWQINGFTPNIGLYWNWDAQNPLEYTACAINTYLYILFKKDSHF